MLLPVWSSLVSALGHRAIFFFAHLVQKIFLSAIMLPENFRELFNVLWEQITERQKI